MDSRKKENLELKLSKKIRIKATLKPSENIKDMVKLRERYRKMFKLNCKKLPNFCSKDAISR